MFLKQCLCKYKFYINYYKDIYFHVSHSNALSFSIQINNILIYNICLHKFEFDKIARKYINEIIGK